MKYETTYRQRVLEYLSEGHTIKEAKSTFKVSRATIWRWQAQLAASGTLAPRKLERKWRKIDPKELHKYVENHPDATLSEISNEFNCSITAIFMAMKKLKITRKKNRNI